ncbi:g11015 [Coccomyxa elongata]
MSSFATLGRRFPHDDQWNVIWLPLSEDIVHALYKYVQTGEKSTYPFVTHFFNTFLRLSGHNGLTRSLAEGGQSQESPTNTPDKGEASKDKAGPRDKASKEGEDSADVARSRNQALPEGTDPASLKALHEEEIRLGDVGGPIEFVFTVHFSGEEFCTIRMRVRPKDSLQPGQPVKAVISYSSAKACFSQDPVSQYRIMELEDVKDVVAFIAALFVEDIHTRSGQWLQERLDTYTTELRSAAEKFRSSKALWLTNASRKHSIDECV